MELLKKLLGSQGYKLTAPRMQVFAYLKQNGPVKLPDLASALANSIDRASTYRTIDLFTRLGITQQLILGGKKVVELTDDFMHHHHHLSCLQCGKLATLSDSKLEAALSKALRDLKFTHISHQIEVGGYCQNCAKLNAD